MTLVDREWLYLRVYSGAGDDVGALLPELSAWSAPLPHPDRWHFVRYVDMTGHHLRVRMRGTSEQVDVWYEDLDQLRDRLEGVRPGSMTRVLRDPAVPSWGSRVRVELSFYSPEFEKYAGAAGMEDAEVAFHYSSLECVAGRVWEWEAGRRLAQGVAFLRDVDLALGDLPGHFVQAVADRWAARLAWSGLDPRRLPSRLPELVDQISADLPANASPLADFHAEIARRHRRGQPTYPLDLVHMHLNRLGLSPPEEGLAAHLATQTVRSAPLVPQETR